jgi:hypothetical protein
MESAFNQLQTTSVDKGCPPLASINMNGRTAATSYLSCWPDASRSPQNLVTSGAFTIDGTHVNLPGRNEYLLGDNNGNVYGFGFGQRSPSFTYSVDGTLTAPPAAIAGPNNLPSLLDLIAVSGSDCGASCVAVMQESSGQLWCFLTANARISGRPAGAANPNLSGLAYFGDASGTLFAYAPRSVDNCPQQTQFGGLAQPIVSGPVVFAGSVINHVSSDEIYVVASDANSSHLVHFTYSQGKHQAPQLQLAATSFDLPANAKGLALQSNTLPARLAVTFAGGQVAVVQIQSDFSMVSAGSATIPTAISGAPYWCHCSGGNLIGVTGHNGLYLFDAGLNPYASYGVSGTTLNTAPAADGLGDWFFGANDGYIYEVQTNAGSAIAPATKFGNLGAGVGVSTEVGVCPAGLCIYTAVRNGNAYLIELDARDAVLSACISSSPPTCSGDNPHLWATAQVQARVNPQTVRVTGWSYYSP